MDAPRPLSTRARWILRIALVVAWASGVGGAASSFWTLWRYRSPTPVRITSAPAPASASASASAAPSASASPAKSAFTLTPYEQEQISEARIEALDRYKRTRIPLSAANLVLSMALVIGAARTIGRRPGGRAWLQQVCFATVLFAGAEYMLSREERGFYVERVVAIRAPNLPQMKGAREQLEAGARLSFVLNLLAQLGLYGGLALALGRPSVGLELAPVNDGATPSPPSSRDE